MMSRLGAAKPKSLLEQKSRRDIFRRHAKSVMRHDLVPISRAICEGPPVLELNALRGLACLLILIYNLMPHRIPGGPRLAFSSSFKRREPVLVKSSTAC